MAIRMLFSTICYIHLFTSRASSEEPQSQLHWGLPDSVAVAGKLYEYYFPSSGELEDVTYGMTEEDISNLPPWLYWNKTANLLSGVPTSVPEDELKIQITVFSGKKDDNKVEKEKDYFFLKILPLQNAEEIPAISNFYQNGPKDVNNRYRLRPIHCTAKQPQTTATILLDADVESLNAIERIELMRMAAKYLSLSESSLRLQAADSAPLLDSNALVAGPGDVTSPEFMGMLLQWEVGCGNVMAAHMPGLELLEISASNGSLALNLGYGIVGWHITNKRPKGNSRRFKRHAYLFNKYYQSQTPVPSIILPTRYPGKPTDEEYSGDPYPTYPPESLWLPPQLEIKISTSARDQRPGIVDETSSYKYDGWETSKWPDSGYPDEVYPSSEWTGSPTSAWPTGPPSSRYPTDSEWPTYPSWTSHPSSSEYPGMSSSDWDTDWPESGWPTSSWTYPTEVDGTPTPTAPVDRITPSMKTPSRLPTTTEPGRPSSKGHAPVVLRELGKIEVEAGAFMSYQIPEDAFYDEEDGWTRDLDLIITDEHDQSLSPASWLKINHETQTIYGGPLADHVGKYIFQVGAVDSTNLFVKTPLHVTVNPTRPLNEISNEFSVRLDVPYERFVQDVDFRMDILNKLGQAFGDEDSSHITITEVSEGSVVIKWTNNTLPTDPCPQDDIDALQRKQTNPDGSPNQEFIRAMRPYVVQGASGGAAGACDDAVSTPSSAERQTTGATPRADGPARSEMPTNDWLIYVIIGVVVVLVLIVLLIVICILCLKKKRQRQEKKDVETEKLNTSHKGIPIIFADELEETPPPGPDSKEMTPASTLKSKKDTDTIETVPPPEYPKTKTGSASSTLKSECKKPLLSDSESGDGDEIVNEESNLNKEKHQTKNIGEKQDTGTLPVR